MFLGKQIVHGKQFPRWTTSAPAKLNLYLNILGQRDDGFHELETLMVPVRFCDSLQLKLRPPGQKSQPGSISLDIHQSQHLRNAESSAPIPTGQDNLVVRSLQLLQRKSGCDMGVHVNLVKRIPAGSGLGGGSSDAAAALQLANQAWNLDWGQEQLVELAAEIGSDVPFFLLNRPAVCRGRGELLEPLPNFLPLHFVIVRPPLALATAEVYRAYAAQPSEAEHSGRGNLDSLITQLRAGLHSRLRSKNRQRISALMKNSLQNAASRLMGGWIDKLRKAFDQLDLVAHQLTGSGSAYFGICRNARQAAGLATRLRAQGLGLVLATCSVDS